MRNIYIENNNLEETLSDYLSHFNALGEETISAIDSIGRTTFKAIYAKVCDPTYNASAMDGICVISDNTINASDINPLKLNENEYRYVNTGNPIYPPFDSVIMIEDVIEKEDGIYITSPSYAWQNIRTIGETVVATEMVLPSNTIIRPFDLGAILASGNEYISVIKKPKVGIIPTGNEMVEKVEDLKVGSLMESNSRVFVELIKEYGGDPNRYNIVKDVEEELECALLKAVKENDVVIINAGSSAGTKDFSKKIIEKNGKVYYHGLAIKPGKPTILGEINGKPVIGVPGYPVSSYIVMEKVVKKVVCKLLNNSFKKRDNVKAILSRRITSTFKNEEFIRVSLGYIGEKLVATPLERGAAQVMSMIKADGLLTIDRYVEGIEAGEEITVELLKPLDDIKKKLVIIGSHDVILDVVCDLMPAVSSHVGSMGGILALKNDSCHIAPIHLLDKESGEYNIPFIKKYFNEKMCLIKGVGRTQGLLIEKGNPKGIKSLRDLEKGYTFANRQNGAGTRLLFDYLLSKDNISPLDVKGYDKEYNTHLAVATAVKNNVADFGMAVYSAAKIMDLDFIEVGKESYDFLVPFKYIEDEKIKQFINILKSIEFKNEVEKIGGYTFDNIGEIIVIND